MKRLQFASFGDPKDVVKLVEVNSPKAGPGDVIVELEAAPINPADFLLIQGWFGVRPSLPAGLGNEGVGRIVGVGAQVDKSRLGQRVLIVPMRYPTWCEQVAVNADDAIRISSDADPLQMAMLGVNPFTAHALLTAYVTLKRGDWVAQTGAPSAVSHYLIALARLAGVRTLTVVRSQQLVQTVRDLGGDAVFAEGDDLADKAVATLRGQPLHLIVDAVGGRPVAQLATLAGSGAHVISYSTRDMQPVSIAVPDMIYRGLTVHGYFVKMLLDESPKSKLAQTYGELAPLVADGTLSARVEATYRLEEFHQAFNRANAGTRTGKVLFSMA